MKEKDKNKCIKTVYSSSYRDFFGHQCTKKVVTEVDGHKYCKIHDPEYIKEKDKQREIERNKDNCKNCNRHFYTGEKHFTYCPSCGIKRK